MVAKVVRSNPPSVREPTGYTHAIEITGDCRRLMISGQVGMAPDGTVPASGEEQVRQALTNLEAILKAHGMTFENVVKTTAFLINRNLLDGYRQARVAAFGAHKPASTLLFVAGLADPRWLVEIEAEAVS